MSGWYQPGTTPWAVAQAVIGLSVTGLIVGLLALALVLPFLVWVGSCVVALLVAIAVGVFTR